MCFLPQFKTKETKPHPPRLRTQTPDPSRALDAEAVGPEPGSRLTTAGPTRVTHGPRRRRARLPRGRCCRPLMFLCVPRAGRLNCRQSNERREKWLGNQSLADCRAGCGGGSAPPPNRDGGQSPAGCGAFQSPRPSSGPGPSLQPPRAARGGGHAVPLSVTLPGEQRKAQAGRPTTERPGSGSEQTDSQPADDAKHH